MRPLYEALEESLGAVYICLMGFCNLKLSNKFLSDKFSDRISGTYVIIHPGRSFTFTLMIGKAGYCSRLYAAPRCNTLF